MFLASDTKKVNSVLNIGRGRGVNHAVLPANKCLCTRPYSYVLCNVCGYLTSGRVRYLCPLHPQTIFLFDISQCPRCKSYEFMMTEF